MSSNIINLRNFKKNIFLKFITCIFLGLVADILFYDENAGWTSGFFTLLLCAAYILHTSRIYLNTKTSIILFLIGGQAIALFESSNWISYLLITAGFILLIFLQKPEVYLNTKQFVKFVLKTNIRFILYLTFDAISYFKRKGHYSSGRFYNVLSNWLIPILFSLLFIGLFALANPIIESWLKNIDIYILFRYLSLPRILFWMLIVSLCWVIVRPQRLLRSVKLNVKNVSSTDNTNAFSNSVIIRALVLFNVIFAFQTAMDISYLWGGAELPNGMTYAKYAHKGAYPLMITAMLAAVFVLVSLNPESDSSRSDFIKKLVYAWIGQNILLVISSIWRLVIYIQAYQLTGLRIAALIWMVLVAFGLSMIIIRIITEKDNSWLINKNLIALVAVLYCCSFVNFGGIIAQYNVHNSYEYKGSGKKLDYYYLQRNIGVEALPALIELKSVIRSNGKSTQRLDDTIKYIDRKCYRCTILRLSFYDPIKPAMNWRKWTFRQYRIHKILQKEGFE